MKSFYRSHEVVVNTAPSGTIIYDILDRSRRHLVAGFSLTEPNEQAVMDRVRSRVDELIAEPPVRFVER